MHPFLILSSLSLLLFGAASADPLRVYSCRLLVDGRAVAGATKIYTSMPAAPSRKIAAFKSRLRAVTLRELTLQAGVVIDPAFAAWASNASSIPHDLLVERRNLKGERVSATPFTHCTVTAFQAQPDLDSNVNRLAFGRFSVACRD